MHYQTFARRRKVPNAGPDAPMELPANPLGELTLAQLTLYAAAIVGSDGHGEGGVLGYLTSLAQTHPRKLAELLRASDLLQERESIQAFPQTRRDLRRLHCKIHDMLPEEFEKIYRAFTPSVDYFSRKHTDAEIEEALRKYEETHYEPDGNPPREDWGRTEIVYDDDLSSDDAS